MAYHFMGGIMIHSVKTTTPWVPSIVTNFTQGFRKIGSHFFSSWNQPRHSWTTRPPFNHQPGLLYATSNVDEVLEARSTTESLGIALRQQNGSEPYTFDNDENWLSHTEADRIVIPLLRHYVELSDEQIMKLKGRKEDWVPLRDWAKSVPMMIHKYEDRIENSKKAETRKKILFGAEVGSVCAFAATMGGILFAAPSLGLDFSEIGTNFLMPALGLIGAYIGAGRTRYHMDDISKAHRDQAGYDYHLSLLNELFYRLKDFITNQKDFDKPLLTPEGHLSEDFIAILQKQIDAAKKIKRNERAERNQRNAKASDK